MVESEGASAGDGPLRASRLEAALYLGGAVLLALVYSTQLRIWLRLFTIPVPWSTALAWSLPQLLVWLLCVPLIYRTSARLPIAAPRAWLRVIVHGALSVGVAAGVLLVIHASDALLHWTRLMGAPSRVVTNWRVNMVYLHIGVAVYWVTLAAQHALSFRGESERRALQAVRLEADLAEARLAELRAQLNPHFLFNTLNSIGVLMRHDAPLAEQTLHRLSDMLRSALTGPSTSFVTLEQEFAQVEEYLEIERLRFRDRLQVRYEMDADCARAEVPALLLQPIVENAVRHGVTNKAGAASIAVRAERSGNALRVAVTDDGIGFGASQNGGHGVGLANTRRRLELLYGADQEVSIDAPTDGGTRVTLRLPFRESGA